MDKEELLKSYREDVQWLRDNIPPDDIYEFAEQALLSAEFFISCWNEWVDVFEECEKHPATKTWFTNVMGLRALRNESKKSKVDIKLRDTNDKGI